MLIGPDDHNTAAAALDAAKIKDVAPTLALEYFFVVPKAVLAFCRPQIAMQVMHRQILLLEDGVGVDDRVDI
ncbi:hypothetical protein OSB_05610 [Octadecabacter temperatus]|uniref:Uncharacterized protein n=1 Tax=Octadecabacter temperatus TaxID=1458307 RepID=A0A0K0Y2J0_9RHOB|nr:hypothetical protein OSB_05610 [Octadecabacter temperatus]